MEAKKQVESKKQYLDNCGKNLDALRNYHCAIYAPDKNGDPTAIGSGVLINIYGHKFLVSAGHVFDYTLTHRVCLSSNNKLVDISGDLLEFKYTTRKEDKIDLAILELDNNMAGILSGYSYLTINDIACNHISNDDHLNYTFVGFPSTKNKVRYNSKNVKGMILSYSGNRVHDDIYAELGISPATHLAIKFRKKKLLSNSEKMTNFPDPYGMSGGGIWLNDNFHHHPSIYEPKTKLVGIALSWHKKHQCLMGVSSGAIIALLLQQCNIPELGRYHDNLNQI